MKVLGDCFDYKLIWQGQMDQALRMLALANAKFFKMRSSNLRKKNIQYSLLAFLEYHAHSDEFAPRYFFSSTPTFVMPQVVSIRGIAEQSRLSGLYRGVSSIRSAIYDRYRVLSMHLK